MIKEKDGSNPKRKQCVILDPSATQAFLENQGLTQEQITQLHGHFKVRIPEHFVSEASLKDLSPVLQKSLVNQVLPRMEELDVASFEKDDPIGDSRFEVSKGLIHRYKNRVLVTLTHQCAMYCRFCFRKEKVSQPFFELKSQDLLCIYRYLQMHKEVREVILSGGDPLLVGFLKLGVVLEQLEKIEHIKVVRFHTRIPSARPHLIDEALVQNLGKFSRQKVVVVHVNSVAEMNADFWKACRLLQDAPIMLASQSVLLKGVNAEAHLLADLFSSLYEGGIRPYYLHYPDQTKGTNHFRIPLGEAIAMLQEVKKEVSGLAMPQFTLDLPGGNGKVAIPLHAFNTDIESSQYVIQSPQTLDMQWVSYKA